MVPEGCRIESKERTGVTRMPVHAALHDYSNPLPLIAQDAMLAGGRRLERGLFVEGEDFKAGVESEANSLAAAEEVSAWLCSLQIPCVVVDARDASRGRLVRVADMAERSARRGCVVLILSLWNGAPMLDVYLAAGDRCTARATRLAFSDVGLTAKFAESVVRRVVQLR